MLNFRILTALVLLLAGIISAQAESFEEATAVNEAKYKADLIAQDKSFQYQELSLAFKDISKDFEVSRSE